MVAIQKMVLLVLLVAPGLSSDPECPNLNITTFQGCKCNGKFYCDTGSQICNCTLPSLDADVYFIFGLCAMISTLLVIIAYFRYTPMHSQPGDIILGVSISDFSLSAHWFLSVLYYLMEDGQVDSNGAFCMTSSFVSTFATVTSFGYNVCFMWFIMVAVRNSLKQTKLPKAVFHVASTGFAFIYVIYFMDNDRLGMSYFGICSDKTTSWNIVAPIIPILYVILALYTYFVVRKYAPECQRVNTGKREFLQYYTRYSIISTIVYSCTSVSYLLMGIYLDELMQSTNSTTSAANNEVLRLFNTLSKISLSFVLSLVRYTDPFISPYMKKMLNIKSSSPTPSEGLNISLEAPLRSISVTSDTSRPASDTVVSRIVKFDSKTTTPEQNNDMQQSNGVGWLMHNLKVQLIYTILSGIIYSVYSNQQERSNSIVGLTEESGNTELSDSVREQKVRESKTYKINDDVLSANMPTLLQELNQKSYRTLDGSITIYAPQIFKELMEQDAHFLNVELSLNLRENYTRIQKAGKAIGGKSGEFFFFSNDNRLIIKTITDEELNVLLTRLAKYLKYNKENPKTLIAKIYGVFTFARSDLPEKYNLIVMRNVNGYPSECVERKYDVKGSTFDREVLKKKTLRKDQLRFEENALKDMDFLKYEEKLAVAEELKPKLVETLEKDANFFRECGIIDYSLAVYVVNKKKLKWNTMKSMDLSNSDIPKANTIELEKDGDGRSNKERLSTIQVQDAERKERVDSVGLNNTDDEGKNRNKTIGGGEKMTDVSLHQPSEVNELYSMKSTKEEVYYNLGIIDYLQLYTFQKKMEKIGKRIMKCNPKLDTSSQNPIRYAERFAGFMKKIVY